MDYQELIEKLRERNLTYVEQKQVANAIESLLAENERLNHNLTSTEQTMREYQELAAKRLEEIGRLKDLCTTMDGQLGKRPCQNNRCLEYNRLAAELAKYRDVPVVAWEITFQSPDTPNAIADYLQIDSSATVEQLIVKPGE